MRVELDYGRSKLAVALPETAAVTVIRKNESQPLADAKASVLQALAQPVACASLATLAAGRGSACIVICDITRPVPNGLFLRPMIEIMLAAGIARDTIRILVATGLHRPNEGEELAELIDDPWVLEHIRIDNHDATDAGQHLDLGRTPGRGVPVKLDRRLVEADLRIVTGLVEPHFMAGYSGGRKVIAPGVAHEDTIRTFHNARFMSDPAARQCNLAGNPLHEEQLAIAAMVGEVYCLNTVLDAARRVTLVNFGDLLESHAEAVRAVEAASLVPVPRRFSTIVTSAAGYPLDGTYYQTVKSMVTPMDIMADDARLIIASDCSQGIGSPAYRAAQARLVASSPEAFMADIAKKSLADIDEWQTQMQLKPMRAGSIALYSEGLPAVERALTGVEHIDDIGAAVAKSMAQSGDRAVAVIPEGPYVVPYFEAV
ncbi:MAG: nickel-dependent lactate racemase [Gammaproteobacteria bacterium]|nr:nickel-dependent lactate racemase [Gammaproteobacteria bacterium]